MVDTAVFFAAVIEVFLMGWEKDKKGETKNKYK